MRCSSGGTIANNSPRSTVSATFLSLFRFSIETNEIHASLVTASEPFDRSGPVPAAVRAAGYVSEEEESEEEDGSSVEEEESEEESEYEEEEEDHRHHHHSHASHNHQHQQGEHTTAVAPFAQGSPSNSAEAPRLGAVSSTTTGGNADGQAPPYSVPAEGSGIQLAESGYAQEKKGPAAPLGNGEGASGAKKEVSFNLSQSQRILEADLVVYLCRPRKLPPSLLLKTILRKKRPQMRKRREALKVNLTLVDLSKLSTMMRPRRNLPLLPRLPRRLRHGIET